MRERIAAILNAALERCFEEGALKRVQRPSYVVEVPGNTGHGHFATNLPLTLAGGQRKAPREIAGILLAHLRHEEGFLEKVEVAGPGFINFTLSGGEWYRALGRMVSAGPEYGRSLLGQGQRVLVEFVSANPTGPLHLGHGRGAALGDTLCRILSYCGFHVFREFYINDAGQQVRLLGESIWSRWRQLAEPGHPFPENGYHGEYIAELAAELAATVNLEALSEEEAVSRCAEFGKERMMEEIRRDLEEFRVHFDHWYSESELFASGLVDKALRTLREKGMVYEKDGASWIRTTLFGDDKDRVIHKKDGQYTYFASDISYHLDKWERGFQRAINIWGADHHGYVRRMKAALMSNGIDEAWLSVLLIQLVKLWKGGQELKMSKRAGQYVTLKELMDEVGVDAVRFVFLTKNHDSPLDFDIDLVKKQDSDNPVYYVQYAHARICSVFRKAAETGTVLPREPGPLLEGLVLEEELALIRMLSEFPPLLEDICRSLEPHRLIYYLTDLASLFHKYFNLGNKNPEDRIVVADAALSQARLTLVAGIRIVLHNGLGLLGVNAPERM
ncbi:MAG: arginine--tRNA ligase [Thermodesulfobacteriota bacterium]